MYYIKCYIALQLWDRREWCPVKGPEMITSVKLGVEHVEAAFWYRAKYFFWNENNNYSYTAPALSLVLSSVSRGQSSLPSHAISPTDLED